MHQRQELTYPIRPLQSSIIHKMEAHEAPTQMLSTYHAGTRCSRPGHSRTRVCKRPEQEDLYNQTTQAKGKETGSHFHPSLVKRQKCRVQCYARCIRNHVNRGFHARHEQLRQKAIYSTATRWCGTTTDMSITILTSSITYWYIFFLALILPNTKIRSF